MNTRTIRLQPGSVFAEHYQVISLIGASQIASVYVVRDQKVSDERQVLKLFPEQLFLKLTDRLALHRLVRQSKRVSSPWLARILEFVWYEGLIGYGMQFIDGQSLRRIAERGRLSSEKVFSYVWDSALGLAALHAAGLLHRNIKPENIFVGAEGRCYLSDYVTPSLAFVSANYAAPEVLEAGAFSQSADVYALGALAYELLTRTLPWTAGTIQALAQKKRDFDPQELLRERNDCPAALMSVVASCLDPDPKKRPASGHKLLLALVNCAKELGFSPPEDELLLVESGGPSGRSPFLRSMDGILDFFSSLLDRFRLRSGAVSVVRPPRPGPISILRSIIYFLTTPLRWFSILATRLLANPMIIFGLAAVIIAAFIILKLLPGTMAPPGLPQITMEKKKPIVIPTDKPSYHTPKNSKSKIIKSLNDAKGL